MTSTCYCCGKQLPFRNCDPKYSYLICFTCANAAGALFDDPPWSEVRKEDAIQLSFEGKYITYVNQLKGKICPQCGATHE
jgi:hypothetical protein